MPKKNLQIKFIVNYEPFNYYATKKIMKKTPVVARAVDAYVAYLASGRDVSRQLEWTGADDFFDVYEFAFETMDEMRDISINDYYSAKDLFGEDSSEVQNIAKILKKQIALNNFTDFLETLDCDSSSSSEKEF